MMCVFQCSVPSSHLSSMTVVLLLKDFIASLATLECFDCEQERAAHEVLCCVQVWYMYDLVMPLNVHS